MEEQINPIKIALSYGISFIACGFSGNVNQIVDLIIQGIKHPGFSFIQILSTCVTFLGKEQYDIIRSMSTKKNLYGALDEEEYINHILELI